MRLAVWWDSTSHSPGAALRTSPSWMDAMNNMVLPVMPPPPRPRRAACLPPPPHPSPGAALNISAPTGERHWLLTRFSREHVRQPLLVV